MHNFNGMGWGMGFGWIFGLLIMIAVIWFIIRIAGNNSFLPRNKSALETLNDRYSRGEIDAVEYERIKKNILQ